MLLFLIIIVVIIIDITLSPWESDKQECVCMVLVYSQFIVLMSNSYKQKWHTDMDFQKKLKKLKKKKKKKKKFNSLSQRDWESNSGQKHRVLQVPVC